MNGIAFAVFVIFIIIAAGVFAIQRLQNKAEKGRQEKWSADLLANKARIKTHKNYGHESWRQEIAVDDDGNASHSVEACIINIGEKPLEQLVFSIYCETKNVPETEVQPWAACGETQLSAQVKNWIIEQGRGQLIISITPPLLPGEKRNLRWGYRLPSIFNAGDEYYNWDVGTPYFEIGGKIKFAPAWTINYARWDPNPATTQAPPKISKNTILWMIRFPESGNRLTMRFGLSKKT
jgi:hypothetical protein